MFFIHQGHNKLLILLKIKKYKETIKIFMLIFINNFKKDSLVEILLFLSKPLQLGYNILKGLLGLLYNPGYSVRDPNCGIRGLNS